ncbi:MAG: 6,7-dimethyl-8-ribityllumazine synthase [Rickettsiales bacterium]|nr:6,7-dimethyl-8-ribityllumazine synthase [Rickettsiales bacterium]
MGHFLIIASNYYEDVCNELLLGCRTHLDVGEHTHELVMVPGTFEIPAALAVAMRNKDGKHYDGYIALGCVIRGETSHYDHVCNEVSRGLQTLAYENALALGFGILTVENREQANYRASVNVLNKGKDAAEAAMRMATLREHFKVST